MQIDDNKKDIFGIIFFALSILMLGYMFITPLNHLIVHMDEYFTISVATLPISDIITVNTWDVHPPLHYLLGKLMLKVAGIFGIEQIFALKVLSIIPYIFILIISAVKIKKDYGWLAAGLFTFSLAVMSEFFIYYLTVRMYSWAILFLLIAFLAFKEIIEEPTDKKYWIVLTVFAALCAYTHYFAAIAAGCVYLILLGYLINHKKEELKTWGLSVIAAIVLFVPWIPSLINQLTRVHASYWIPQVDANMLIDSLGFFAYGNDTLFAVIAIIILAVILIIYFRESKNLDEKDQFIILSGIGVYVGTILISVIISVVFKPILMVRYLMPAAAVLWLTVSIIMSKIEDRKMFLISFVLICLLLITGIATTITTNDTVYQHGIIQKEILDNITKDNNSMVIVTQQNMIMYFLDYANQTDMYCLNVGHVFGDNMNRLQKLYDFKTYNGTEIDSLIANNTDKNIYIISWNDPELNSTTTKLHQETGIVFSKVDNANMNSTN